MSAIWGAIDLNNNKIDQSVIDIYLSSYKKCVIDDIQEVHIDNYYIACGIQYFTPESHNEKLPIINEDSIFSADVVLDNRSELLEAYSSILDSSMPDGTILYHLIHKFGLECMNTILGSYSFIYYDKKSNSITLSCDAVGSRCLYYQKVGSILYFSTLLQPLIDILVQPVLNDRWLTDFLAMDHLFMINETMETPIKDIYRLSPAEYLSISESKKESIIYWDPFKNFSEIHFDTDGEYKQAFLSLWEKTVNSQLRSEDPISILLSGGLDSTAVAAVASPTLKKQNKTLYSYTSVPKKGFIASDDDYYIEDETDDVLKTAEYYGNIDTHFVDLDGKTPWELMDDEFNAIEIPFKSIQNFLWIAESCKQAYQNGSRIMLTGSYGNTSISYTDLNVYMNHLYKTDKRKFKEELKTFSQNMGFPYDYALNEIKNDANATFTKDFYPYKKSFVNRDLAKKLHCEDRLAKLQEIPFLCQKDYDLERTHRINWLAMRQIGEVATKHSLYTGVLLRDPTRAKQVIEFCVRLPLEQYCKEGLDRRLVKEYMKDLIPSHIINFSKKGKQSADLQFRFQEEWDNIRKEWISIYDKYYNSRYVDTAFAKHQLMEQPDLSQYKSFDLVRHMYTIQVLQYENRYAKIESLDPSLYDSRPLISVIVPIYQAEDIMEKCIDSIRNQTYTNLEIILVDDGSTDNSPNICDDLATKDSRIIVIHQKNSGVSAARNAGLKVAKGDFIGFVDSDDWIDPIMYEKLYELISVQKADISCCSFEQVLSDRTIHRATNSLVTYYGYEMLDSLVSGHNRCFFSPAVWNKLYRKELLNDISFYPLQLGEDYLFLVHVLKRIKKGVFLDKEYYHYIKKENSLTEMKNHPGKIQDYITANTLEIEELKSFISDTALEKKYYNYFCLLLNDYCKVNSFVNPTQCKMLLQKELKRMGKISRFVFKKDFKHGKMVHYEFMLATYNPSLYKATLKFEKTKCFKVLKKIL